MKTNILFIAVAALFTITSCEKEMQKGQNQQEVAETSIWQERGHLLQTNTFSSEAPFKWIDLQLQLFRTNPTPIGGLPPMRIFAYSAAALYEAVVPGMPSYQSLSGQLKGMPSMPQTVPGFSYHWPTCVNAALAAMCRNFFPNTTAANKFLIDSLENALNTSYQSEEDNETFLRSSQFGKEIAQLIFDWSKTDGASHANDPYTPPVGPGLWAPTPPAFAAPFGPYWGNIRLFVTGSLENSDPPAPPPFSTDPSSDYYKMVKEVYDVSQSLTSEQITTGLFYRDNPGFGGGHYVSIFRQVLEQQQPKLDFTAMACAKIGMAMVDAGVGCWKTKYQYNQERPIRYIREVLGHTDWNPLFGTPNFPDFPSGHSTIAGAFAEILRGLFGSTYHFTDHSYDFLGMAPHSFNSFDELANEIGESRLFAGIHYRNSCQRGLEQGKKIGQNIDNKIKFLKE